MLDIVIDIDTQKVYDEVYAITSHTGKAAGNIDGISLSEDEIRIIEPFMKEIMTDQLPDIEDENPKNIEIRIDIERALEQLPEEIKEIVILFFFQGLKQKEIADLLNIKLSLVKYRVSKAKELLAKQLEVEKL